MTETTDQVIGWASTPSRTELEDVLWCLRSSTEGDEAALAWRLVRHHQKSPGMNVSWDSMVDEVLDISSVRSGQSWVEDTTSAPVHYVVSDTRRLTVHQVTTELPKQPLNGETEWGVRFTLASPRDEWSPEATSFNTPPSFRKPLGRSTAALGPAGASEKRKETVAEHLTTSARKGSEASAKTAFENTPQSFGRLAPLFTPVSEACAEDSQTSTSMKASYLIADEGQDWSVSPSPKPRPVARNVSRYEVGTRDTLQIMRKCGVAFSGKLDPSAEEFLTRVQSRIQEEARKQWRLPGQEAHPFFLRRIQSPRRYISSLGFDERMFIHTGDFQVSQSMLLKGKIIQRIAELGVRSF